MLLRGLLWEGAGWLVLGGWGERRGGEGIGEGGRRGYLLGSCC